MRREIRTRLHLGRQALLVAVTLLSAITLPAEIIDGVAAVVGLKAVTHSEVDRELRLEALFNLIEVDQSPTNRTTALSRLIERRLIRQDLDLADFLVANPSDIDERMREFRPMRFVAGRDFPAALLHYNLSEQECREFLSEQISFERYVAFRFKTGLDATDQEIANYYQTVYSPQQKLLGATLEPLDDISKRIGQVLVELQADRMLDVRIRELRALTRIEILDPEFGGPQ